MPIAYVLISCELGSEKAIVDELKSIEGVKEVQPTYGIYDVIAKVEVQDEHKLREVITFKIRKMNQVRSTITLLKIKEQE
jgi:DNA-binding Lrp family transcriptional regulator